MEVFFFSSHFALVILDDFFVCCLCVVLMPLASTVIADLKMLLPASHPLSSTIPSRSVSDALFLSLSFPLTHTNSLHLPLVCSFVRHKMKSIMTEMFEDVNNFMYAYYFLFRSANISLPYAQR